MYKKLLIFVLLFAMTFLPTTRVLAKDPPPEKNEPGLSVELMKDALVVNDAASLNRQNVNGKVFKFKSCNTTSQSDAPCYYMVDSSTTSSIEAIPTGVTTLAGTNATITCGINIYSRIGAHLGRLQENINVTFTGTYGRTPVTMNWGDLRGTAALPGYTWGSLSGPTPNPNWGSTAPRTGQASAISSVIIYLLVQGFPIQAYASIRLIIDSNGWYCQ